MAIEVRRMVTGERNRGMLKSTPYELGLIYMVLLSSIHYQKSGGWTPACTTSATFSCSFPMVSTRHFASGVWRAPGDKSSTTILGCLRYCVQMRRVSIKRCECLRGNRKLQFELGSRPRSKERHWKRVALSGIFSLDRGGV